MILIEFFHSQHVLTLQSISQKDGKDTGLVQVVVQFVSTEKCDDLIEGLIAMLLLEKGVNEVRWEKLDNEPSV